MATSIVRVNNEVSSTLSCGGCQKTFPTSIQVKQHIVSEHDKQEKQNVTVEKKAYVLDETKAMEKKLEFESRIEGDISFSGKAIDHSSISINLKTF